MYDFLILFTKVMSLVFPGRFINQSKQMSENLQRCHDCGHLFILPSIFCQQGQGGGNSQKTSLIHLQITFDINSLRRKSNDKVPNAIPSILGETLTNVQSQEGGRPLLKRLINRDNNIIIRLIDYRLGPRLLTSQEDRLRCRDQDQGHI